MYDHVAAQCVKKSCSIKFRFYRILITKQKSDCWLIYINSGFFSVSDSPSSCERFNQITDSRLWGAFKHIHCHILQFLNYEFHQFFFYFPPFRRVEWTVLSSDFIWRLWDHDKYDKYGSRCELIAEHHTVVIAYLRNWIVSRILFFICDGSGNGSVLLIFQTQTAKNWTLMYAMVFKTVLDDFLTLEHVFTWRPLIEDGIMRLFLHARNWHNSDLLPILTFFFFRTGQYWQLELEEFSDSPRLQLKSCLFALFRILLLHIPVDVVPYFPTLLLRSWQ